MNKMILSPQWGNRKISEVPEISKRKLSKKRPKSRASFRPGLGREQQVRGKIAGISG